MPKELPEDWISGKKNSLNVFTELGLKSCPVSNLSLFRNKDKNSKKLQCRWLPMPAEIDIRPFQGRTNGGKGQRVPYEGSTHFEDPYQAGKAAIQWYLTLQKDIQKQKEKQSYNSLHSLHHYWEIWWGRFSADKSNSKRNCDDRLNDWNGKGFGLGEQEWSHKSIDQITRQDIAGYFSLIDARGDGNKGSMAGRKKTQKTLLNKLNKEALDDFPELKQFSFPQIPGKEVGSTQKEHFLMDEWKTLLAKVNELADGAATKKLSEKQYQALQWDKRDKFNQRNWVDLYDCLNLMYYFFLRSEDIPRIQTEWFKDMGDMNNDGDPKIFVYLEKTKKDRLKQETEHFYARGYEIWKRIEKRRPSGLLCFPHISRRPKGVIVLSNELLKKAVELSEIKKRKPVNITTVRHTSLRLTLEDMPPLVDEQRKRQFADNANTSVESLNKHYLKYVQRSSFASEMRKKLPEQNWSLIKRVGDIEK